jgi:hypothetical protein
MQELLPHCAGLLVQRGAIGLTLLHLFSLAGNEIYYILLHGMVKQEAVWAGQGTGKQRGPKGQRGGHGSGSEMEGQEYSSGAGGACRRRCHAGQTGLRACSTSGLLVLVLALPRRPLLSSASQKDRRWPGPNFEAAPK